MTNTYIHQSFPLSVYVYACVCVSVCACVCLQGCVQVHDFIMDYLSVYVFVISLNSGVAVTQRIFIATVWVTVDPFNPDCSSFHPLFYSTLFAIWGEYQIQSVCLSICLSVFPAIPVR